MSSTAVEEALRSGEWKEKSDPKSGKKYYYNPVTKKTTWDLAKELAESAPKPAPTVEETPVAQATTVEEDKPKEGEEDQQVDAEQKEEGGEGVGEGEEGGEPEAEEKDPSKPASPAPENPMVKVEDFLQSIIGRAALPQDTGVSGDFTLSNTTAISKVSNSTLLQMLGCEGGIQVSKPPIAKAAQVHPSHTRLSLLSRLSDEFKAKRSKMQDTFEDIVDEKRKAHEERLTTLNRDHEEKLEAIRTRYGNMIQAKRTLAAEANAEVDAADDPMAARRAASEQEAQASEIAMLERRILQHGGAKNGSSATVSARRLLTFWKTKYENLCSAFEQQQEQHFTVKAKLDEANALMGQNSRNLQSIVTVLRDREQKERHRGDSVKTAYLQQCQKQGLVPEDPEVSASKVAGSQLSHTKLMMIAQHGYEAVQAAAPDGQFVNNANNGQLANTSMVALAGTMMLGTTRSSSNTNGDSGGVQTFTKVGAKAPNLVRAVHETVVDRREECRLIELSISENDKLIEEVGVRLETEQGNYSRFVATVHGPGAALLEEAVSLNAQTDRYNAQRHARECEKLEVLVAHATKRADLVESIERLWAEGREHEEALKRDMREKEIDMVRIRGKINSGQSITLADFSDAPVKDPRLKLDVLRSQLAVLDCERQLLRSRLKDAGAADAEVMRDLEQRLKIPAGKK